MTTITLHAADAAATEAFGARLAPAFVGGMVVTLSGELGSGKTTLVRGCLRALGWRGTVKSPTYTLVENYAFSSLYFYHFDFYRFDDPAEWDTAGLADCFRGDSVCLVEWPEHVAGKLPSPDLEITLSHPVNPDEAGRFISLRALTREGERCARAMSAPAEAPPRP